MVMNAIVCARRAPTLLFHIDFIEKSLTSFLPFAGRSGCTSLEPATQRRQLMVLACGRIAVGALMEPCSARVSGLFPNTCRTPRSRPDFELGERVGNTIDQHVDPMTARI